MIVMPDTVEIDLGPLRLKGLLGVPSNAEGLVIFAHGSGSGRLSPRNNRVAAKLRSAGLATLLLDLLTPEEEQDRANVFDISLGQVSSVRGEPLMRRMREGKPGSSNCFWAA